MTKRKSQYRNTTDTAGTAALRGFFSAEEKVDFSKVLLYNKNKYNLQILCIPGCTASFTEIGQFSKDDKGGVIAVRMLIVAPFDPNGRYKGGICSIANMIFMPDLWKNHGIDIRKLNTCLIRRDGKSEAKVSVKNVFGAAALLFSLIREIKKQKIDVVYFHSSVGFALWKDLLIVRIAKFFCRVKVIVHIHSADGNAILSGSKTVGKRILAALKNKADGIVFLSSRIRDEFVRAGIDRAKTTVIYNCSNMVTDIDRITNKKHGRRNFIFVGMFTKEKGLFDLLDCVEDLKGDFVLNLCGEPLHAEDDARLKQKLAALGDRVICHGFVSGEKKTELFTAADVLVLPSYSEGVPVVILEALCAGCGIVTTDVGAIGEIIDGSNGRILPPGDSRCLREALQAYIDMDDVALRDQQLHNHDCSSKFTPESFIGSVAGFVMQPAFCGQQTGMTAASGNREDE